MRRPLPTTLALAALTLCSAAGPATAPAENLIKDTGFANIGTATGGWLVYADSGAVAKAEKDPAAKPDHPALLLTIDAVTATPWQAQVYQSGLTVTKGEKYLLTFTAVASAPRQMTTLIQLASDPYTILTDTGVHDLTTDPKPQTVTFTATADSADAKVAFIVGQATGKVTLSDVSLTHVGH